MSETGEGNRKRNIPVARTHKLRRQAFGVDKVGQVEIDARAGLRQRDPVYYRLYRAVS